MRGKWLAVMRTKNPLIWNSTNDEAALLALGTGESA